MRYLEETMELNEFGGKISPYQLIKIRDYAIDKGTSTKTVKNWANKGFIYIVKLTRDSTYVISFDRRESIASDVHPTEWTVYQIAEILSVHVDTVIRWAERGHFSIYSQGDSKKLKIIKKNELLKNLFSMIEEYHS